MYCSKSNKIENKIIKIKNIENKKIVQQWFMHNIQPTKDQLHN
jgi:hypothetical protein